VMDQALARYRAVLAELGEADRLAKLFEGRETLALRAVEVGEEDRLSLVESRVQRLAACRARLDVLKKAQAALGALEDAVMRPLDTPDEQPEIPPSSPREGDRKEGQP
jgi:hypothetical protein